jgi:glycosyltransferase involved in cell wall biosynthesis
VNVAVVLPAYNEAPIIARVIEAAKRAVPEAAIWVVDDGSTDHTGAIAREADAAVLALETNRGKGVAVRHAIDRIDAGVLVFLDADGQDDPAEIPKLVAALDHADLVLGSRFLGRFERGAIQPIDRLGTRALTLALNLAHGSSITDPIAGFRAARSDFLRSLDLRAERYDIEIDMVLAALRRGAVIREVPVRREPRRFGHTNLSRVRDGSRMLARIVASRVRRR